jgi:hypothetical protein
MSLSTPHPHIPANSSDVEILRAFEPIVQYTKGEKFYPMAVEPYLRESSLWLYVPDGADEEVIAEGDLTLDGLVEAREAAFGSLFYLRFVYPLDLHRARKPSRGRVRSHGGSRTSSTPASADWRAAGYYPGSGTGSSHFRCCCEATSRARPLQRPT